MRSRVFKLYVTCCLIGALCKNVFSESEVFASINEALQSDARVPKRERENAQIEKSIKTEARPSGILKNDLLEPETSREFPLLKDLKTKTLNDFKNVTCSRREYVNNLCNIQYSYLKVFFFFFDIV